MKPQRQPTWRGLIDTEEKEEEKERKEKESVRMEGEKEERRGSDGCRVEDE